MATGIPHGTIPGAGGPPEPGDITGPPPVRPGGGWTAGRVVAVVAGALLALVSLAMFAGGGVTMWADQTQRQGGYLTTRTVSYSAAGYAVASDQVSLPAGFLLTGLVGDVRLRVTPAGPGRSVFVAIGPADRVSAYLSGVPYTAVTGAGTGHVATHSGAARPAPPRAAGIWAVEAAGTGTQTLVWTARSGDWMAVAMNPGGSAGLTVRADAGVSAPGLFRLAVELIIGGVLAGVLSVALIVVPVRLAARAR